MVLDWFQVGQYNHHFHFKESKASQVLRELI